MGHNLGEFTLSSNFQPLQEIPEETAIEYILRKVREYENNGKTFIIDSVTKESFSYEAIDGTTGNIASALYKKGFRKGDVLIYQTYDLVKLPLVFIGVWRANGVLRASYPEDTPQTLQERVEETHARWIYCEEDAAEACLAVAEKINWNVEVIVAGKADGCTSIYDYMMDDGTEMPEPDLKGEDPGLILCTSGTTGASKGALITQSAVLFKILSVEYWPFTLDKPNLFIFKGTHISGSIFPLSTLCSGKMAIVMSSITKLNVFKAVDSYKPGFIWGFPTFLLLLVNDPEAANYDFSSLEVAASGGAPVTPAIEKSIMKLPKMKAVINCYGLTEVVIVASQINLGDLNNPKIEDIPLSSLGKVFPGVLLQIRDRVTNMILGPNSTGEICVKGPGVFSLYMNNPKATEAAFVDGWFKTGDIGYYDKSGFIFLVDRAKEIFKYFNNHISPTEIETAINEHPSVREVCVIGVPDPNGGGHIPRAFVTLKNGKESTPQEIKDFANERLADYKHIRGGLYFVAELPKGKTGKVTRQLVEQLIV